MTNPIVTPEAVRHILDAYPIEASGADVLESICTPDGAELKVRELLESYLCLHERLSQLAASMQQEGDK